MDPTKQFIQDLIGNELAYINTRHPDFADARNQVSAWIDLRIYTSQTYSIHNLNLN